MIPAGSRLPHDPVLSNLPRDALRACYASNPGRPEGTSQAVGSVAPTLSFQTHSPLSTPGTRPTPISNRAR